MCLCPVDPERVFQASLTSAQVLIPGSQAMVSSMLLEGHSLLALATIMFAPGGIDQVWTFSLLKSLIFGNRVMLCDNCTRVSHLIILPSAIS